MTQRVCPGWYKRQHAISWSSVFSEAPPEVTPRGLSTQSVLEHHLEPTHPQIPLESLLTDGL